MTALETPVRARKAENGSKLHCETEWRERKAFYENFFRQKSGAPPAAEKGNIWGHARGVVPGMCKDMQRSSQDFVPGGEPTSHGGCFPLGG